MAFKIFDGWGDLTIYKFKKQILQGKGVSKWSADSSGGLDFTENIYFYVKEAKTGYLLFWFSQWNVLYCSKLKNLYNILLKGKSENINIMLCQNGVHLTILK